MQHIMFTEDDIDVHSTHLQRMCIQILLVNATLLCTNYKILII